jgi:hypothetical protein
VIFDNSPQGSDTWLQLRRGVVTASRFHDCRERLKSGAYSKACTSYAQDLARERVGGLAPQKFQTAAMKTGQVEEPMARMAYEARTGYIVDEVGFACTDDRKFGVSVDGLIGADGVLECKTMVSSDTLFAALVQGDISAYRDQCLGAMWLLRREWVDLCLWAPDLNLLHIVRVDRDDDEINALEADLVAFEALVSELEVALSKKLVRELEPA